MWGGGSSNGSNKQKKPEVRAVPGQKPSAHKNTVVCDGVGGIKIQVGNTLFPEATEKHEGLHKEMILKDYPNVCIGQAPDTKLVYTSREAFLKYEKPAYQLEVNIFKGYVNPEEYNWSLDKNIKLIENDITAMENGTFDFSGLIHEE